jgi:hypothetical protein
MAAVPDSERAVIRLDVPEEHDHRAAAAYLQLLVAVLRGAPVVHQRAERLLRVSRLPLVDKGTVQVAGDLHKIAHGTPLSPVPLVPGPLVDGTPRQIVDGYHRVCASYFTDGNTDIACRLVDERPAAL